MDPHDRSHGSLEGIGGYTHHVRLRTPYGRNQGEPVPTATTQGLEALPWPQAIE